jgi:multidrug transporter EmrE-like cation transporter
MAIAPLALILLSISLSATAQILFKLGMSSGQVQLAIRSHAVGEIASAVVFSPNILGGLSLYAIGTIVWLGVLTQVELSQAYPFVGLGFVLTAAAGYFGFGDSLGPLRIAGIILILAGISLVART